MTAPLRDNPVSRRVAFRLARTEGYTVAQSAEKAGVSPRTGDRYEVAMKNSTKATAAANASTMGMVLTHAESIRILSDDIRECATNVRPQLVLALSKMQGWLKDATSSCPRCQWTEAQPEPPSTRQWLAWSRGKRAMQTTTLPPPIPQSESKSLSESASLNPKNQAEIDSGAD